MFRRFRFLRLLKWAGTLTCLLIPATFIASAWCALIWTPGQRTTITIWRAELSVAYILEDPWLPQQVGVRAEPHAFRLSLGMLKWRSPQAKAWAMGPPTGYIAVPLWLLFLVALTPTLLLWRLDRRRVPPGHCRKCRYNLAGNTAGRCPECGAPFAPAAR